MKILNIAEKYDNWLTSQRKIYPCHTNRASQIGHPCLRYLFYMRTSWQEQELPSISMIRIFEEGRNQERLIRQLLLQLGYHIEREQESFEWRKYQITGTIDGVIIHNGKSYCFEFKSLSDVNFKSINSIEDIKNSKKSYIRNYIAQIMTYLMLSEKEQGILLLKNKSTGELKEIVIDMDYDYMEEILKKVEKVNEAVAKNEPPERYETPDCMECPFLLKCQPTIVNTEPEIGINNKLDEIIDKIEMLKEQIEPIEKQIKEYDKLKKDLLLKTNKDIIITNKYMIEKKVISVKPRDGYEYIKWDISPLEN